MTRLCRLDTLAGREQVCPAEGCPFWESGGAVLQSRCVFERIDLAGRPAFVAELLRLRDELNAAASGADERSARHRYHQLLNESEEE